MPAPTREPAISIRGVVKRYGRFTAVKDLDLDVQQGEILGFLGLNGAGKTTTIRILLDLLRPTSGQAFILGKDCQKQGLEARSQIGFLPGEMGLYPDLTGLEVLDLLAGLGQAPVLPAWRRQLQQRFELPDADLRRRIREYSTGMKRKLGLIQAFQTDPLILILDEPTEGLDPLMQEAFYDLLIDARRRGRTVFMSSHVLSEVERICDRLALLRGGELVLTSRVDDARRLGARRVKVVFSEDVAAVGALPPGHELIDIQPRAWTLEVQGVLGPLLSQLASFPLKDVEVEEPKLEDVLTRYYREGAR